MAGPWERDGENGGMIVSTTPAIEGRPVKHYLGVSQTWKVSIEYQDFGDQRFDTSKAAAFAAIPRIVDEVLASFSPLAAVREA